MNFGIGTPEEDSEVPHPTSDPTFQAVAMTQGTDWYVLVTWPNGRQKQIDRFESEAAALAWIANESKAWLARLKGSG